MPNGLPVLHIGEIGAGDVNADWIKLVRGGASQRRDRLAGLRALYGHYMKLGQSVLADGLVAEMAALDEGAPAAVVKAFDESKIRRWPEGTAVDAATGVGGGRFAPKDDRPALGDTAADLLRSRYEAARQAADTLDRHIAIAVLDGKDTAEMSRQRRSLSATMASFKRRMNQAKKETPAPAPQPAPVMVKADAEAVRQLHNKIVDAKIDFTTARAAADQVDVDILVAHRNAPDQLPILRAKRRSLSAKMANFTRKRVALEAQMAALVPPRQATAGLSRPNLNVFTRDNLAGNIDTYARYLNNIRSGAKKPAFSDSDSLTVDSLRAAIETARYMGHGDLATPDVMALAGTWEPTPAPTVTFPNRADTLESEADFRGAPIEHALFWDKDGELRSHTTGEAGYVALPSSIEAEEIYFGRMSHNHPSGGNVDGQFFSGLSGGDISAMISTLQCEIQAIKPFEVHRMWISPEDVAAIPPEVRRTLASQMREYVTFFEKMVEPAYRSQIVAGRLNFRKGEVAGFYVDVMKMMTDSLLAPFGFHYEHMTWSAYEKGIKDGTIKAFTESLHPRHPKGTAVDSGSGVGGGRFAEKDGEGSAASGDKVWAGKPVDYDGKIPSKIATGKKGERLAAHLLEQGTGDKFYSVNKGLNNAALDLVGDGVAVEVKTGLATNLEDSQHWRATIGEPGDEEAALIAKMGAREKRAYNARKIALILERKAIMLEELSAQFDTDLNGVTLGIIITPELNRADVYVIPGFHSRLAWPKYAVEEYYLGTFDAADLPALQEMPDE